MLLHLKFKLLDLLFHHFHLKNLSFPSESIRTSMETVVVLNIAPIITSHRDLDYLPLADKDLQIKDLTTDKDHLKVFFQCRNNHLNGYDAIGLWESNLPMYFLPSVHVFLDMIHQCHENYDPNHRAVMSPNQTAIFTIIVDSINEMLQFHPS